MKDRKARASNGLDSRQAKEESRPGRKAILGEGPEQPAWSPGASTEIITQDKWGNASLRSQGAPKACRSGPLQRKHLIRSPGCSPPFCSTDEIPVQWHPTSSRGLFPALVQIGPSCKIKEIRTLCGQQDQMIFKMSSNFQSLWFCNTLLKVYGMKLRVSKVFV